MKMITFREGLISSPVVISFLEKLDFYFEKENYPVEITEIIRTRNTQLKVIENLAKQHKIISQQETLDFTKTITYIDSQVPYWQWVWSKLLAQGVIVNPPVKAVCLFKYIRPSTGEDMQGKELPPSPHFYGKSFDIGGYHKKLNVPRDLNKIQSILQTAKNSGLPIKNIVVEPKNNCVHVDIV